MPAQNITKSFSNSGTRNEVRQRVIAVFLEEESGTGTGDNTSRYNYFVETLSDGKRIYLTRPAPLRVGFDFVIRVENMDFSNGIGRRRNNPTHEDINNDCQKKLENDSRKYREFYELIESVFNCNDVSTTSYQSINFSSGYPVDMILGVIKWFFIEQDIRYWNYSGRNMFMSGLPEP